MSNKMHYTMNPVPSDNPCDAEDNARAIDEFTNTEENFFTDRNKQKKLSITGISKYADPGMAAQFSLRAEAAAEVAQAALSGRAFMTKALADSAMPLPDSTLVFVTNDSNPENNGNWISNGNTLIKSLIQGTAPQYIRNRGRRNPFVSVPLIDKSPLENIRSLVFVLDARIFAPSIKINDYFYRLEYMQNGAVLSGISAYGLRVCRYNKNDLSPSGRFELHTPTDAPAQYDLQKGGIQTFSLQMSNDPSVVIELTLDCDAVSFGQTINFNGTSSPFGGGGQYIIDPNNYFVSKVADNPPLTNKGFVYPFLEVNRENDVYPKPLEKNRLESILRSAILEIKVLAPSAKINGYYYKLAYLQNGNGGMGIRVLRSTYENYSLGIPSLEEQLHTPTDAPAQYDLQKGGIQTFSLQMASDKSVTLSVTLDVSALNPGSYNMWSSGSNPFFGAVIDPSCYFPTPEVAENFNINGVMLLGASLAYSGNSWFSNGISRLGIKGFNKAASGVGTPSYFADKIYKGTLFNEQEFEDTDVLAIQFASSFDLDSTNGLFDSSDMYTDGFDKNSELNQFTSYTDAQCLDYILKYWQEKCYSQRDNLNSKWHQKPFGKPCNIMLISHWHDGRPYYNNAIRVLAERWGASICPFDKKIGFSKNQTLYGVGQVSKIYAMDNQTIDGVVYGWHPLRSGEDAVYIQNKMASIFYFSVLENYS